MFFILRTGGAKAFYEGSLGEELIDDIKSQGGSLTLGDLLNYRARVRKPVESVLPICGVTLLTPPAPGSFNCGR